MFVLMVVLNLILGPGTVFIDNTSYVFMFLSIATSNLVATSLARQVSFFIDGILDSVSEY